MPRDFKATYVQGRMPNWKPLLDVMAEEHVEMFLWVAELKLDDGAPLHAYRHIATRRLLYLDDKGRTFVCTTRGRLRLASLAGD